MAVCGGSYFVAGKERRLSSRRSIRLKTSQDAQGNAYGQYEKSETKDTPTGSHFCRCMFRERKNRSFDNDSVGDEGEGMWCASESNTTRMVKVNACPSFSDRLLKVVDDE